MSLNTGPGQKHCPKGPSARGKYFINIVGVRKGVMILILWWRWGGGGVCLRAFPCIDHGIKVLMSRILTIDTTVE